MAHRHSSAVAALLAVVLLAGCGGSGKSASSPPTTADVPTTAAAPLAHTQLVADQALARRAVLRLADVPVGYKSTPTQNTPADDVPAAVAAHFSACTHVALPVVTTLLNQRAGAGMVLAASPNFVKSESELVGTDIASAVEVHATSKQLGQELDQLGAAGALPCWKAFFNAAATDPAGSGTSVRALDVRSVPSAPLGDQIAAVGATITVANGAQTVQESLDFSIARRGRADAVLLLVVEGGTVDRALERSLLAKMVSRLQTATGN
jgi:hypothetical protein